MTIDCAWISKNLEALFCDKLPPDQDRLARAHIGNCEHCKSEVQALIGIDVLIKKYFHDQLAMARVPRRRRLSLIYGVAIAAAAAILLVLLVQRPVPLNTQGPVTLSQTQTPQPAPLVEEPAVPAKGGTVIDSERAKPSTRSAEATGVDAGAQTITRASKAVPTVPEFLVTDPAGYSRTLQDYRGHVLLIGVWESNQSEAVTNLERLYKTFGSNSDLRFLGVSNKRQAKPTNTTFPAVYNQGSRLFGTRPGEFVLLDESGSVILRGSLVKDFEDLREKLQRQ